MISTRTAGCRHRFVGGGMAVAMSVLAACGSETQVTSSTATATPETSVSSTQPVADTAPAESTTTAVVTTPDVTVPVTSPTTAPATTAPPSTTAAPPTTVAVATPATAFASVDTQLVEVDVATGSTTRVLDEFFSVDGVFRGGLRLSPDRSTIWFSEGYEDGWYGCESSVGSFGRVDTASGGTEVLGVGSGVEPSADGAWIAYLASSLCLPDPESPANWVLTPYDRVVLRDLATGEERVFVTDSPPDAYGAPGAVDDVTFTADTGRLLVLTGDGRLFIVDPDGSNVIQEHPVLLDEVAGVPLAAIGDLIVTVDAGAEGATDVHGVNPYSGDSSVLASSETFMSVGVDVDGNIVANSSDGVTVVSAGSVTVVDLPGDPFVYDIDW